MAIQQALENLGLTARQAVIYWTLLQTGPATAYLVASRSSLKRPTVYVNLEELRSRGLVNKIPHAKKTLYVARDPAEAIQEAQERLDMAKQVLPELRAITAKGVQPQTLFFEGTEGLAQALEYGLEEVGKEALVGWYASVGDLPKAASDLFAPVNEKMRGLGVRVRGFAPKHPSLAAYRKMDAAYGREIKTVPASEYDSRISMDAGPTFVRMIAYADQQAVIIRNAEIAKTFRQVFEMLWRCKK